MTPAPHHDSNRQDIILTDQAVLQLQKLLQQEQAHTTDLKMRIFARNGGSCCNGSLEYGFSFDSIEQPDDLKIRKKDFYLLADALSYHHLKGATIDCRQTDAGAQFVIDHVQQDAAAHACACNAASY